MNRTLRIPLISLLCGALSALPAQDDKPKPDPEVKEKLEELEDAANDRKMEKDAEAVAIIDELLQKYEAGMHEKDVKSFLRELQKVLSPSRARLRPPESIALYKTAAVALGQMGEEGARVLKSVYDGKRIPDKAEWVPLREVLLVQVGKTEDLGMVKFLIEEARRAHESALMAAAGEALGNFADAPQKVRKDIVEQLLIRYGEVDAKSRDSLDPNNLQAQNAQDRLAAISDKWNTTLSKLTGQNFRSLPEWQEWWNDNKNKDWDKDKG